MAAGRHLGFRFRGHNFWTAWARHFKFGTGLEIYGWNMRNYKKLQHSRSKMAAARHLGFRFRFDNFWTARARHFKFGSGLEIYERNMAELPKLTKVKIPDGRRPPLNFGLEAIKFERLELDISNFAQGKISMKGTWRNYQNSQKSYPRWPPFAICDFGSEVIAFERLELDISNLA